VRKGSSSSSLRQAAAVAAAAAAAAQRCGVQYLHLSNNSLGDQGASLLSKALGQPAAGPGGQCCSLIFLELAECGIGNVGAMALGSVLATKNRTLQTLVLSYNEGVANSAAMQLSKALEQNNVLKRLWLNDCGIGDDAVEYVAHMFTKNTTLVDFTLDGNLLSESSQHHLLVSRPPTLLSFEV
jgi:Ran GTPase-activating protein (RanGAP) involved in mRNA processing and transport